MPWNAGASRGGSSGLGMAEMYRLQKCPGDRLTILERRGKLELGDRGERGRIKRRIPRTLRHPGGIAHQGAGGIGKESQDHLALDAAGKEGGGVLDRGLRVDHDGGIV